MDALRFRRSLQEDPMSLKNYSKSYIVLPIQWWLTSGLPGVDPAGLLSRQSKDLARNTPVKWRFGRLMQTKTPICSGHYGFTASRR